MKPATTQRFCVQGEEAGLTVWYVVEVEKMKLPLFEHMMRQKNYDLKTVATILAGGWGAPDEAIVAKLMAE